MGFTGGNGDLRKKEKGSTAAIHDEVRPQERERDARLAWSLPMALRFAGRSARLPGEEHGEKHGVP